MATLVLLCALFTEETSFASSSTSPLAATDLHSPYEAEQKATELSPAASRTRAAAIGAASLLSTQRPGDSSTRVTGFLAC